MNWRTNKPQNKNYGQHPRSGTDGGRLLAPAAQRETFENPMERLVDGYVADLKALDVPPITSGMWTSVCVGSCGNANGKSS